MLSEWYRNGLAQAYIIFEESYSSENKRPFVEETKTREDFEKLIENRMAFEQFLDKYKEIPLRNIRLRREKENQTYYDIKYLFPRSSRQRVTEDKDVWKVIGFDEKGSTLCSICGHTGTRKNTVLIFPFERKVLNYFPAFNESQRIRLCRLCQKICFYGFGNIYYNNNYNKAKKKGRVTIFFPDSGDYERTTRLTKLLHQIRLTDIKNNPFSNIRPEGIVAYYPFEFLYSILYTFYRWSGQKDRIILNLLSEIKIELISYLSGKLNIFDTYDSISRLDELFRTFHHFEKNIRELNKERNLLKKS